MEVSGHDRVFGAEHANVKVAEIQMAHGFRGGILPLIAGENHLVAVLDRFADEGGLHGIVITVHEVDDVAAIPRAYLIAENLADGVFRRLCVKSRAGEEQKSEQRGKQMTDPSMLHWAPFLWSRECVDAAFG